MLINRTKATLTNTHELIYPDITFHLQGKEYKQSCHIIAVMDIRGKPLFSDP